MVDTLVTKTLDFFQNSFKTEIQFTYNTVLVSSILHRDSVFFLIIFHYRLLEAIEYNSPCYKSILTTYLFYVD